MPPKAHASDPIPATQIQSARQADLPSYLTARGEQLEKDGDSYRLPRFNGLIIKGNRFTWDERNFAGNALDFVRFFYAMNLYDAVLELTGKIGNAL